jgi:transposase
MTRPYSLDLRERMVRAVEAGASRRATAARFGVSPSCVVKLVQRWSRSGSLAPDPGGGGRRAKLADHAELVQALLAASPDLTIAELKSRLAAAGIAVSPAAISRFLKACGLTRKKRPRMPPSKTGPMSLPPGAIGARVSRR